MRLHAICRLVLAVGVPAPGQPRSTPLRMPYGAANPLISPDGAYALYGSDAASVQLWLENRRTRERRTNGCPEKQE
jgi:hypothetical protein